MAGVSATRPSDPRRRLGALGERLAREHLERAGYRVLERNFRCRHGELDIVAAGHGTLVFCEVKTRVAGRRGGPEQPLEGIGSDKRRRLRLLAREWLNSADRRGPRPPTLRFDAIGVTVGPSGRLVALDHLEGAF